MKRAKSTPSVVLQNSVLIPSESQLQEVLHLIHTARHRAFAAVNTELVDLYWKIGNVISRKIALSEWGEGVIPHLALRIQRDFPNLRGFTRANLFRMRQFYETYQDDKKVVALLRQLPWTHHMIVLGRCKIPEERQFYLRMAIKEQWSSRQLERQFRAGLFERALTSPPKVAPLLRQRLETRQEVFKDSYIVEFLDLPDGHSEADLHRGLVNNLKDFLIELGRDFCFVGSEYPLQVGKRDFSIDLLFFHRGMNCLVVFELKIDEFQPEHLGKLGFYLEAIDKTVRKPHENPPMGILLCASKDHEVVEFALSSTASPAMVAEYRTKLPDKNLLRKKLHEFYMLSKMGEYSGNRSATRKFKS